MKFLHGFTADRVHCIAGVTSGTSVPETAVNFIRGMGFLMVPVEQIGANTFLAAVTRVLKIGFVLFGHVRQPFMGKQRLIVLRAISQRRNDGDRIFGKVVGAMHEMTGQGNGVRSKRIDVCDVMKQTKFQTTPAENIDIGTTVREDFFLKIENIIAFLFRCASCHKRFPIFRIHPVRIAVGRRRNGAHIIIVFFPIEEMRKVTFVEFFDTERFREIGEFHRNEVERVDEPNVKHVHRQT